MSTPPITSRLPATSACTSKPWPIRISPLFLMLEYEAGKLEILGVGHLQVARFARDEHRLHPHALDGARLVGDFFETGTAQRFGQRRVAEHLRGLRPPQARSRLRERDALLAVGALQRIGHGN